MARKLCADCGVEPKKPGHPKWCVECQVSRLPVETQALHARRRAALVPEGLRVSRVPASAWPPGRRWCAGCQSFPRLRDCRDSRCVPCASTAAHASALEAKYVIHGRPFTREDYEALGRAQGWKCYLCRRSSKDRRLAVDHDHASGEVRGLLCPSPDWGCNLKILPRFDADPDPAAMAARLVEYLTAPPAQRILS